MESEHWRSIIGYEGYYECSDQGRIRSVDRVVRHKGIIMRKLKGRIMRVHPVTRSGYLGLIISKKGKERTVYVHRVVAEAWIGPYPDGQEVRHGPAGKLDNTPGNLSYGTPSENQRDRRRDGTHYGKAVRRSDGAEYINTQVAAEETSCNHKNISAVCNGHRNTAGGYGWKHVTD